LKERTNQEWLTELRLSPPQCNEAMESLRVRLLAGLTHAFSTRPGVDGSLLEDLAQESLLRVLSHLDSFRGESRFLAWAHTVAVRVALTEFRRRRWRDISLESFEAPEDMFASRMESPEEDAVQKDLLAALNQAMRAGLTEKQRLAMLAVRFHGMPLEEAARRMGTNRSALYKLLHDARRRLKRALLERGLTVQEIMEAFE
jgi:RNA polymerase sigma-70 factor (ECF subfamily)